MLGFPNDCLSSSSSLSVPVGGCTFDDGPAQCDYQQDPYDDFDWTHVSAQEVPYLSPELPQGKESSPSTSSSPKKNPKASHTKQKKDKHLQTPCLNVIYKTIDLLSVQ